MAEITLFCSEASALKLGPGAGHETSPDDLIVFVAADVRDPSKGGYATFEADDFPRWAAWAFHPGTPHIEVLSGDEVPATFDAEFVCPVCSKAFASKQKLNGHRMSHKNG